MRYNASFAGNLGETRIELESNTYSDAYPMLRRLVFRKMPVDLKSQALALATAILTERYCGEVFEFSGVRVGSDYAEAIRTLLGERTNVVHVDGMNRAFSTGEIDVLSCRATDAMPRVTADGNTPLARVDWSGDFVDPETRSSSGFAFGNVQTNALYFADAFRVSVAIGLLFGRDRCRTLIVPAPGPHARTGAIAEALRIVGITLHTMALEAAPPSGGDALAPMAPARRY
jgi:hypothetical protein